MKSSRFLTAILLLAAAAICAAQQPVKKVPIKDVSPASGQKMFAAYCASCHGLDGKGAGPAASSLKTAPADLTGLAKANGGKFPYEHVYSAIIGDTGMPSAHGSKEMPVWGSLFSSLTSGQLSPQAEIQQRATNLTDYVQSLQK